jgi:DNA modification methylase
LPKASSVEGDLIFDPFAGVGTSLVVCRKLERNYIGIEQNPEFVKVTKSRIAAVENEMQDHLRNYA